MVWQSHVIIDLRINGEMLLSDALLAKSDTTPTFWRWRSPLLRLEHAVVESLVADGVFRIDDGTRLRIACCSTWQGPSMN